MLTLKTIPESIKEAEFAMCGPIVLKAEVIGKALQAGKQFPFEKLTRLNVGNPQNVGQPPISFNRSVMACLLDNGLFENPSINQDIKNRSQQYLDHIKSVGQYTQSQGLEYIRQNVANFIESRDEGIKCDKDNIILTDGTG